MMIKKNKIKNKIKIHIRCINNLSKSLNQAQRKLIGFGIYVKFIYNYQQLKLIKTM